MQSLYDNLNGETPSNLVKLVAFSDLHVDFAYTPGNSNDCGRFICCRSDSGPPRIPSQAAGYWGDYYCDMPAHTIEHMLDFIRTEIKPDFAFWTGDTIAHNLDSMK